MSKNIININSLVLPKSKEKIFLGEYSGFQRYDNPKYNWAVKLEEKQRNAFWNPGEIKVEKDSHAFKELPEFIQEVMINIWLFQTLMDSAQNKGLEECLANIVTNSEVEALVKTWGYFELIHSLSYSHILRGIFSSEATSIFNRVKDIDEIKHRVDKEISLYSKLLDKSKISEDNTEAKKFILELLLNIFALEGVKFYVSFLVTYIVNNSYNSCLQGPTRIIKLINFDEDLHTTASVQIINTLRKETEEGFSDLVNSIWFEDKAKEVFTAVYENEMAWSKYLLSIGPIPSLTEEVISAFLKYYIDIRLGQIKLGKIYNQKKTDVVQWFEKYKDLNKDNSALQESDLAVYSVGILENNIPEGKLIFDYNGQNITIGT